MAATTRKKPGQPTNPDTLRAMLRLREGVRDPDGRVINPPWSVAEICAAFGISRMTYFRRMAEVREAIVAEESRRADADADA